MINDLIANPYTETDTICNIIIYTSNSIAKNIGISYSELWIGIMLLVCFIISYYIIISYGSLYSTFNKTLFKWLFWIGILFIWIIIFAYFSLISFT